MTRPVVHQLAIGATVGVALAGLLAALLQLLGAAWEPPAVRVHPAARGPR